MYGFRPVRYASTTGNTAGEAKLVDKGSAQKLLTAMPQLEISAFLLQAQVTAAAKIKKLSILMRPISNLQLIT